MTAETHGVTQSRESLDLRNLIETIPALVLCALPDGSVELANRAWQEYTGCSLQQLSGWVWQTTIHPDDVAKFIDEWTMASAGGKPFQTEARIRRADGQYHWFLIRKALAVTPTRGRESSLRTLIACEDINERKEAEAKLQESEILLQAFFENSPNLIFVKDRQSRYLYANKEFKKAFHVTDEIKGKSDDELFSAEQAAALQAVDRQVLEAGLPTKFEDVALYEDGQHARIVQRFPLFNAESEIYAIGGVVTDISERKRAEEALQKSQSYLAEGQRLAHMGSWAFNTSGFFEYWSQELFKIYGLDPQKGAPTLEQYLATVHPADRDFMAETIRRMHAERSGCDVKKRIVRPDGELRYIRCVGIPVVEGEVLKGFLGTAMDITEQELLTRELERQQAYLAEAQKLTHTASWAWRVSDRSAVSVRVPFLRDRFEHISGELYRIYGFDPAEGAPTWEEYFERIHPEDRLKWTDTVERAIVEKADYDQEFRILFPNGKVKWIRTVGHPVLSDTGDLEQFVGSSTDITELKSAEQERERLRQLEADLAHTNRVSTLGEMAASLAHEIKQPIAAAITSANSCIEWLAHEPPNLDRARAAAARIDKYGNRAAEIIDRIRSFYKKSPPRRELVDVNGIIQEMLTLLNGEAARYSVAMGTELAAELPKITADRVQLQQVFMNLMLNAIEAMKDSGGELTVTSQLQDGQVLLSVSDTGVGLPTENVDQIFSAFITTKPQGSGMGLAISRSIVESHGGQLWATANDGRGATFHFTLPTHMTETPSQVNLVTLE